MSWWAHINFREGTAMPGAGRYERWLQNSRIGLIAAALAAAAILYGVRYFIGS
jgi:hypothetical protein